MKPKLLRASVLGFLVGGLIIYAYFRYVDPVVEMKHLLQESNRDKERIIDLQDKLAAKDDSLDVFKLNHAAIQAYDRQTWNGILQDSLNILKSYDKAISDTLDSLYRERAKLEIEKTKLETEKNIWKAVSEKWSE